MFNELGEDDVSTLIDSADAVEVRAGDTLFKQGRMSLVV